MEIAYITQSLLSSPLACLSLSILSILKFIRVDNDGLGGLESALIETCCRIIEISVNASWCVLIIRDLELIQQYIC